MDTLALIRKLRKEKGMSQLSVAELLNMSQSAYLQIEKGNTELTVGRLEQIAKILDVSLYTLMGIEDNREAKLDVLKGKIRGATLAIEMASDRNATCEELIKKRIFFWVEAIAVIHKMILAKGLEMGSMDYKSHASQMILDYPSTVYKEAVSNPLNKDFTTDVLGAFPMEGLKPVLDELFQNELFHFLAGSAPFDMGLRKEERDRTKRKNVGQTNRGSD